MSVLDDQLAKLPTDWNPAKGIYFPFTLRFRNLQGQWEEAEVDHFKYLHSIVSIQCKNYHRSKGGEGDITAIK